MEKVSIIIPAYNEEKRIGNTLEKYSKFFEEKRINKEFDYEIVVAINNTCDKTPEIVKIWNEKNKRIVYLNLVRGGKGYAVIEGFKDALKRNNDLIGFVDADMATSPKEYWKLIKNIEDSDGIIGSRYIKGSLIYPRPSIQRLIAKRMFNSIVRGVLLLNYRDTQCGAKIFKRNVIEKILPRLSMSKWAFDVDLIFTSKREGFKIKEIPTCWGDVEDSKINFWSVGPWMILGIVRLRLLNSPFSSLLRIYDKTINKISK